MGIGLFWAFLHFGLSGDEAGWDSEEGEVRFVERELLLLEAGRDEGAFLAWWTGQDEREETIAQLETIMADHEETARVAELRWYLAEDVESGRELFSEEEQRVLLGRSLLAGLPWVLAFGGAFVAGWMGRKDWQLGGRISRLTGAWSPSTVLVVVFLAHILGDYFIYDAVAGWLFVIFGDDWGFLLSNFLWRGGAAILASFALIGSWRGIGRVFGLRQAVRWRPVLGVFCVLVLCESLQQLVGVSSEVLDPSDFFLVADPGTWEVLDDVMDGIVFAPIFEEVMFRGVLFLGIVRRLGPRWSALISSTFFALMHTQYDPWEIFSVGVFGLGCCWLTWRTGSLKSSIVLHMIYNGLITASVYLLYQMPL